MWMIYGATGYTGRLVAQLAVERGHQPILAGRSADKLIPLADKLRLPYRVFPLDDPQHIVQHIADVDIVYHAAGPFAQTSAPMLKACLLSKTHYLDITGEITVFETVFDHAEAARAEGILLLPGVGFDVVPTDCLAKIVSDKLPTATCLEIAISSLTHISSGTGRSALGIIANGGLVRRNGRLEHLPLGQGGRRIFFPNGPIHVLPIPWGDLSTAFRTTGIPNITTYMAVPKPFIHLAQWGGPSAQRFLSSSFIQRLGRAVMNWLLTGPDETTRRNNRAYVWARASDTNGEYVEAWLETAEPYQFTAMAGVMAIERLMEKPLNSGALTPALALGADFVLSITGTRLIEN